MSITLYGSSDDLIELDGDISEEFPLNDNDTGDLVAFSDGTVLRITYTNSGVWRITHVAAGSATVTIVQAPEHDPDDRDYSDRATIEGAITWAVHGIAFAN